MPRVLYADVDGTLVGPMGNLLLAGDGSPSLEAVRALIRARQAGLEVVGLSGRSAPRMFELGRLLGLPAWIAELGGVRVYEGGLETHVERGAFCGPGDPVEALRDAATLLVDAFPGHLEPHDPWNENRHVSLMLRGEVDAGAARRLLAERGFEWAELLDNGVIPRRFERLALAHVHVYHLAPKGISKRDGVVADQHHRGLDPSACAVVGDASSDLACADVVAQCFVVRNGVEKDPSLAEAVAGVPNARVTRHGFGAGFAEAVELLLES